MTSAKTTRIRELNDAFRRTFSGGKVMMTAGVYALPDMVKAAALQKAATFDEFTEDNDPHGEHDFGSFELCGRKFFWKIDYYDRAMEYGSEDPSDPRANHPRHDRHARLGVLTMRETQTVAASTPSPTIRSSARTRGWYFGRTSRFGDLHALKGPYSSERSVALMIARELIKEIVKRDSQHRLPA